MKVSSHSPIAMLLRLQETVLQIQSPPLLLSTHYGARRRGVAPKKPSFTRFPRASAVTSRTQSIMERISGSDEVGGAGGAYSYNALKRLDQLWSSICSAPIGSNSEKILEVVSRVPGSSLQSDLRDNARRVFDVIVCGGTLGVFVATALSSKGLHVGIVERNILKGREQEWNISRKELMELVKLGLLSEEEIEQITAIKFNPNRCGFEKKGDIWVEDILNLGVSPVKLLEIMKKRFISLGGIIFEGKSLSSICIYDDVAILQLNDGEALSCRLVIDSMGNFSPVVRQAFPAGSGPTDRTTYMFTYVDAQPGALKLEELLEEYWDLMPAYQGISLDQLEILRVIFGIFPTYRDSPLSAAFDRVLQVGDASGIQSPVSFGGFGSIMRHLSRLSTGIYEAMAGDLLDSHSLRLLNPYLPNLSASWLFQRAMSARPRVDVSPNFINELLYVNFQSMQKLGDSVLRPFLQDVIQFGPLVKTLGSVMLSQPLIIPSIFKQVGTDVILDWSVHFMMLGYYTFLSSFIDPIIRSWVESLPPKKKYEWRRQLEAWKYGAGLDYNQTE
ncbi:uncharacterized protein LOC109703605 isoform X3 [Ananas comosus]|uniref:Uncharacterized protein LOC109703605 isoform X3 n=1 Tax=Ananas comosus TaxID=4615 RepID=A0A6P5EE44_ANACO|nr:uncharacterized protein LOC109703605 isoform X3 [Ananas comosus]